MIEATDLMTVGLILLIALIATALRKRAGLIVVLWAIAIGLFIAARIVKYQVMTQIKAEILRDAMERDLIREEMERELYEEILRDAMEHN